MSFNAFEASVVRNPPSFAASSVLSTRASTLSEVEYAKMFRDLFPPNREAKI